MGALASSLSEAPVNPGDTDRLFAATPLGFSVEPGRLAFAPKAVPFCEGPCLSALGLVPLAKENIELAGFANGAVGGALPSLEAKGFAADFVALPVAVPLPKGVPKAGFWRKGFGAEFVLLVWKGFAGAVLVAVVWKGFDIWPDDAAGVAVKCVVDCSWRSFGEDRHFIVA